MQRRQRAILTNIAVVMVITAIAVVSMINLKDYINRSEAMRAMNHLGKIVLEYRKTNSCVPPESYVESVKGKLEGSARLVNLKYRARWINFDCTDDEILAYYAMNYPLSFLDDGCVVLRLGGQVEWMEKQEFETLLAQQQSPIEIEMQKK